VATITSPIPEAADAEAFSIGDLADELNITTRTIRYYEERGLISPGRTLGRQRVYTRRDRGHLKLILKHRDAGFSIEEMKELLDIYDAQPNRAGARRQMSRFRDILLNRLRDVDERIETLQALRGQLRDRLDYAERELGPRIGKAGRLESRDKAGDWYK
jgi:DNA-binding transcriptional MerR regulator